MSWCAYVSSADTVNTTIATRMSHQPRASSRYNHHPAVPQTAAMTRQDSAPGSPETNTPKHGITARPVSDMTNIIGTASHVHRLNASTGSGQASVQRGMGSRASQVTFTWRLLKKNVHTAGTRTKITKKKRVMPMTMPVMAADGMAGWPVLALGGRFAKALLMMNGMTAVMQTPMMSQLQEKISNNARAQRRALMEPMPSQISATANRT